MRCVKNVFPVLLFLFFSGCNLFYTDYSKIPPDLPDTDEIEPIGNFNYDDTFIDLNGNQLTANDLKGKVVFFNFWASWCGPCRSEMPEIQKLYAKFKNNDNIIFIVASNEKLDKIKEFINSNNYTFPVYKHKDLLYKNYEIEFLPTTLIINKEGKIIFKYGLAANWNDESVVSFLKYLAKQ